MRASNAIVAFGLLVASATTVHGAFLDPPECALENSLELFACQDALTSRAIGTINADQDLACCKGIFGGSGALDSKPERYNETSDTWFTLENFLPMGCLCDDDIYGQDPDFFD